MAGSWQEKLILSHPTIGKPGEEEESDEIPFRP